MISPDSIAFCIAFVDDTELGLRMLTYVSFHFAPITLVIPYLLAGKAKGEESAEFLDFRENSLNTVGLSSTTSIRFFSLIVA